MKIKDKLDFSTKYKPITFKPTNSIQQALEVMCDKNIGSIIVVNDDDTVAGIVTERDMMIRVLGARIDPDNTPLSKIMSRDVHVANENDDLVDWMHTMTEERFRHLPIVDENSKLVHMISQGDFVAWTWPDLYEKVTQDLKDKLGSSFQLLLVVFAVLTLSLIAFGL
ncbi:MAG: CBS domain-containing protein [Rickettsiales bacterium]|nr:CBS domain-containing protein [Rickettsiales bacterium]